MRPGLMHQLRFRFAFSRQRREAMRAVAYIIGLMTIYAVVGTLDYQDALRQEAITAEADARLQRAALVACMNGGAPGLFTTRPDGVREYIVCTGDTMIVSDENVTRRRGT